MGKNYTSFSYKNTSPMTEKIKINGTGSSYELGYNLPLKYKDFSWSSSITLNDYNATGESITNNLEWKTSYIGLQNTIDYQFYDSFYLFISAQAGLNLSTIVYGKQQINNSANSLMSNKDFSGLELVETRDGNNSFQDTEWDEPLTEEEQDEAPSEWDMYNQGEINDSFYEFDGGIDSLTIEVGSYSTTIDDQMYFKETITYVIVIMVATIWMTNEMIKKKKK